MLERLNNRYVGMALAALALLGLVLFLAAPGSNRLNSGSTWGHGPDGYSAWYAYMVEQGAIVQRWQRPITDLSERLATEAPETPVTLVQIMPHFADPDWVFQNRPWLSQWLEDGHRLVLLGQKHPVTAAAFTTEIATSSGSVKVQTRRRIDLAKSQAEVQLADEFGALVWRDAKDNITFSITPFLAANAYQNEPGNFLLMQTLAGSGPIWIDEYLHGYRDADVVIDEVAGSWLSYLAQTPLLIAGMQAGIILLVLLAAQNQRPGSLRSLESSRLDNSEAYIRALAGVLHKADSRDFLVNTLQRCERRALQRSLGLGDAPASPEVLQAAWQRSTGRPVSELAVLNESPPSETALESWLDRLQRLHTLASQRNSIHE